MTIISTVYTTQGITTTNNAGFNTGQGVATLADGSILVCYSDGANSVRIMKSTDAGATFTLFSQFTAPATFSDLKIATFADGSVGVLVRDATYLNLRYRKVGPTGTLGNWEIAAQTSGTGNGFGNYDMDVSPNGVVLVVYVHTYNGTCFAQVRTRGTGNAWVTGANVNLYSLSSGSRRWAVESASIIGMGTASGVLNVAFAVASAHSNGDQGVKMYSLRVTESSGAQTAYTHRSTDMLGDVDLTNNNGIRRRVKLYPSHLGGNLFTLVQFVVNRSNSTLGPSLRRQEFSYVGTGSFNFGTVWTGQLPTTDNAKIYNAALVFGPAGEFGVRYIINGNSSNPTPRVAGMSVIVSGSSSYTARTLTYFDMPSSMAQIGPISDGTRRNAAAGELDFAFQFYNLENRNLVTAFDREGVPNPSGTSAVLNLLPADGRIDLSSTPGLAAYIATGDRYSKSQYRIHWQFAQDPNFTSNVVNYTPPVKDSRTVDNSSIAKPQVLAVQMLPSVYSLTKGLWYYRAALVDLYGNEGMWSETQSFTVGHPPNLFPVSPTGGGYYTWNGGTRTYSWSFTDPSQSDYQTAYELEIFDVEAETVVWNSGKVVSQDKNVLRTVASQYKDRMLAWRVRGWDSDDSVGPWSEYAYFNLTDPVVVNITNPTANQVLDTGVPTFNFTLSTGGNRTIKQYSIAVTQGLDIVWSQRVATPGLASGSTQAIKMPQGFLKNNQGYSVMVTAIDSMDMTGMSASVPFTVAWVPPATPTGMTASLTMYNVEDEGYVLLTWADTARDPDFTSWVLQRKDDLIDTGGQPIAEGTWKTLYTDYATAEAYMFKDFFAPSNHRVTYRVIQTVNRIGQDIESLPGTTAPVTPVSDGYWLIEPTSDNIDADAFKLSIVTGESFSDEQEEAEMNIIGRGRRVEKGQKLGRRGTLDAQLRHTGTTTARQKRLRIEEAQAHSRRLWLRNPFGDILPVNISAVSFTRIAGTGSSEFCDVSIPYSEVSL